MNNRSIKETCSEFKILTRFFICAWLSYPGTRKASEITCLQSRKKESDFMFLESTATDDPFKSMERLGGSSISDSITAKTGYIHCACFVKPMSRRSLNSILIKSRKTQESWSEIDRCIIDWKIAEWDSNVQDHEYHQAQHTNWIFPTKHEDEKHIAQTRHNCDYSYVP